MADDRRTPGRTNTGGEYTYLAASHTFLPSASADPQGCEHRDGLGSSVVSPCYAVSGGIERYLPIFSSQHRVSFHPLGTQGRDCDINAFLAQGCGCVTNASWRCDAPSTGLLRRQSSLLLPLASRVPYIVMDWAA